MGRSLKAYAILASLMLLAVIALNTAITHALSINRNSGSATAFVDLSYLPVTADIEPENPVQAAHIPDDKSFTEQWGLGKIQAPAAWELSHSSPTVKIAILDSGIDSAHPDLASKVVAEKNFTDSATTQDVYGHGTHVAGIAAAATNNNIGISGVGYNAVLMNVKVLDDLGCGSYSWIAQGIIWAADNGANVINLSMSGSQESAALEEAVDYAWKKGAVIIVSAGNSGRNQISYPAACENAIAVAATGSKDQLYYYSDHGDWVDVTAPGQAYSTLPHNVYGTMAGTSMAAPYVSGLTALAFAVARDSDGDGFVNDEIRDAIESGADPVAAPGTGHGRINALRTLSSLISDHNLKTTPAAKFPE